MTMSEAIWVAIIAATPGALAALGAIRQGRRTSRSVAEVATQVRPNGGTSLHDAVRRIERDIGGIREDARQLYRQVGQVRDDVTESIRDHDQIRREMRAHVQQCRRAD